MTSIKSTHEMLKYVYSLSSLDSTFRFRGQSNFNWTLQPSIYRFENLMRYQVLFFEEALLAHKPQTPIPHIINTGFDMEFLMLCQHYGIPSRLLDWTTDVLVALFFACKNDIEQNNDGALFICNLNDYNSIPAIEYNPMEVKELSFINTSVINPRMRAQSGCFMIWGHSPLESKESSESYDLHQYYKHVNDKEHFLQKIKIPKESKASILHELNAIYQISEESIFISNGYLERNFNSTFKNIKTRARLITLYITDVDKLSSGEINQAKMLVPNIGRNAFHNCINLQNFKGILRKAK